ncbi:MAG TPA: acylglycerol kinase family protein, partial [Candidatus Saccharimonadales bacterium]|nr:acylglycerol kinase family protein [Candidatus Saccharimonadales bacterium]
MSKDILFLINPKSRGESALRIWKNACKKYALLPPDPVDITKVDLLPLIKNKKPKVIVIAGGDGTINSVCDAVSQLQQKPILSIIPLGLGNALSYCLGVENLDKAIDVLRKPDKKITIDLMKTNIPGHSR